MSLLQTPDLLNQLLLNAGDEEQIGLAVVELSNRLREFGVATPAPLLGVEPDAPGLGAFSDVAQLEAQLKEAEPGLTGDFEAWAAIQGKLQRAYTIAGPKLMARLRTTEANLAAALNTLNLHNASASPATSVGGGGEAYLPDEAKMKALGYSLYLPHPEKPYPAYVNGERSWEKNGADLTDFIKVYHQYGTVWIGRRYHEGHPTSTVYKGVLSDEAFFTQLLKLNGRYDLH
jgi:hypothetical protein